MNEAKKKTRRRYDAELKQQILVQCAEPGASVASIALSHGINANVVHKWRREGCHALPALQAPAFVPVPLPPAACAPVPDIRIELRRGATSVSVTWPSVSVRQSHLDHQHDAVVAPQMAGDQRCGSSSSMRLAGCVGKRSSTSLKYA